MGLFYLMSAGLLYIVLLGPLIGLYSHGYMPAEIWLLVNDVYGPAIDFAVEGEGPLRDAWLWWLLLWER